MSKPIILTDAWVVTCDKRDTAGRMNILIDDGRIAGISADVKVLLELKPHADVVPARNQLIVPGFVNAHFHPESALFHDIEGTVPFSQWHTNVKFQGRRAVILDPSFKEHLIATFAFSLVNHMRCGVTTVAQAIPAVPGGILPELLAVTAGGGLRFSSVLESWEHIEQSKLPGENKARLAIGLGPEGTFTVYSFDSLVRTAQALSLPLCAHIAELKSGAEIVRANFKKGLGELLRDFGLLGPSLQLVHFNHGNSADLKLINEARCIITLCPRSAAMKRTGYPLLSHRETAHALFSLGTDWGRTNILGEMKFLREIALLFPEIPFRSAAGILRMGTINGAKALGVAEQTGSIEQGKYADITMFRLRPVQTAFLGDQPNAESLASMLLTGLTVSDISEVLVRGIKVFDDGECLTVDEGAIVEKFHKAYAAVKPLPPARPGEKVHGHPASFLPHHIEWSDLPEHAGATPPSGGAGSEEPSTTKQEPSDQETPPQTTRPTRKPELSKNVRRVFGDDDDVTPR